MLVPPLNKLTVPAVDQLIDAISHIRAQKQVLDRNEVELTHRLQELMKRQKENLQQLGLGFDPPAPS